jgi:hypothetical protein
VPIGRAIDEFGGPAAAGDPASDQVTMPMTWEVRPGLETEAARPEVHVEDTNLRTLCRRRQQQAATTAVAPSAESGR